ncbi:unnamed protein product [Urochloa decumbens]|uniref:Uncharacterized protein n=1 Tax=Urochloa decumbens TaxID=240449 RepID=A0ABC9H301_9POAL
MPTNSRSSNAAITSDGGGTSSTATAAVSTSSILSAETASGRHEFKVEGYSSYKGLASGEAIYSDKFRVGGHCWSIAYFPGGFLKQSCNWICFGLHRYCAAGDDGKIKAEFTLSLLDKDHQPLPLYKAGPVQRIFPNKAYSWSFDRFIKRDDFDSLYQKGDCFCIRCDVTVVSETREEPMVPPPDLHQHLGDLLFSGIGGDIMFDVGSETFVAHKYVLAARSPVFKAAFFGGPMKENAATRVRIHDIEPRVFEAMLHFIYTESVPDIDSPKDKMVMAQHLLVAADRYALERLKSVCEHDLRMRVNKNTAVTTLVLAEQHGCPLLKEACLKILKSSDSYKEALVGYDVEDDLEHLTICCPSLLKDLHGAGLCDLLKNHRIESAK